MPSELKKDLLTLIPSLRAFALCLTLNSSDADDLVDSTLIEIWSRRAEIRKRDLKVAAFAIVHSRYMQTDVVKLASMASLRCKWFATSPNSFAVSFRLLPRAIREAISLVDVFGFDSEQAAEICGCDVETIECLVQTACNRLAETVSGHHSIHLTDVAAVNYWNESYVQ